MLQEKSSIECARAWDECHYVISRKKSIRKDDFQENCKNTFMARKSLANKHYGEGLGIDFSDTDSGKLMVTPYELLKRESVVSFISHSLSSFCDRSRGNESTRKHLPPKSQLSVVRRIQSSHFSKNDPNVHALSKIYEDVTKLDGTPVTTTGATYARFYPISSHLGRHSLTKGIAHNQDEYMDEEDLLLNMEIYMRAMLKLIE